MKLYFYGSSGSVLEYFTMNKIVCNAYLEKRNRKIIHSLGLVNDGFLFLTSKKLKHEARVFGFEQDIAEIPVAIEISIPDNDKANIPAIVLKADGKLDEQYGTMESDEAIGYFIAGEIPYSYITAILLENEKIKDDLYKPSKDLFFPEHIYGLVDDSFTDEIDTALICSAGEEITKRFTDVQTVDTVSMRNKLSSIILNAVLETKGWPYGDRNIANFDDLTLNLLGLTDKADAETEGAYTALKDAGLKDGVLADWIKGTKESGEVGILFNELIAQLMKRNLTAFAQDEFDDVMKSVWENCAFDEEKKNTLQAKIDQIKGLVYGNSGTGLDNLVASFDDGYRVLQGLVFFLRCPMNSIKLADGLEVYKVNPEARRYAWILFAALNGVEKVLAEKTSNEFVMNIAEAYAMEKCQNQYMINKPSSERQFDRAFKLVMEEIVSPEEIRELLMSEGYADKLQKLIKGFFENKMLSKGFKERDFQKIANPFTGVVPTEEYVTMQSADSIIKQLSAALKKARAVYDEAAFLDTFIRDQKKFSDLYSKDAEFWKAVYKDGKSK